MESLKSVFSGASAVPADDPLAAVRQLGLAAAAFGLSPTPAALLPGACVSSGFAPLDKLLPAGGVRRGTLVEWLAAGDAGGPAGRHLPAGDRLGSGVVTLAMATAIQVTRAAACEAGAAATVLVVDRSGWFYPPAVTNWLLGNRWPQTRGQLLVARPSRDEDEIWAIDQALRCVGVGAVVACPSPVVGSSKVMRRWQLAARASGVVGMFVRPWQCRRDPSWAEARLVVMPQRAAEVVPEGEAAHRFGVSRCAGMSWRRWNVARLSSVLYGEGRSCEVVLDLERGVSSRMESGRTVTKRSGVHWQALRTQRHSRVLSRRSEDAKILSLQEATSQPRPSLVSAALGEACATLGEVSAEGGKDGVACRAS